MAQDGTRRVFYGGTAREGGIGNLTIYFSGGSGEADILFDYSWPPVVAVAVPLIEMLRFIPQESGPAQPLYLSADWTTLSTDPVNQAPKFYEWREHLMQLSSDFINNHHYERSSVEHGALFRIAMRPSVVSDEDMVRNGNLTQYHPGMIGHLWRLVHEWAKLPVDQRNGPEYAYLNRVVPLFCKAFEEGRDCLGDIHMEHDHRKWERHLLEGLRFLPDKSSEPYGIVRLPEDQPISSFVRGYDKRNFTKSIRLYRKSNPGGASHPWPASVNSEWYDEMPKIPPVPAQVDLPESSAYEREREITFWSRQYLAASHHEHAANRFILLAYRKFVEMQLLMVMRPENWATREGLQAISVARQITSDYFFDNDNILNAIFRTWIDPVTDAAANAWDFGYLGFDDAGALARAAAPNTDDPRAGGPVVIVPESEIDRTDTALAAADQPWTAQAEWELRLNQILAES